MVYLGNGGYTGMGGGGRKRDRQAAREQACLSERVGHEECAFERDARDGKTRKRHSSHNGRAPTPTTSSTRICTVQG